MDRFEEFLGSLLTEGKVVFRDRPVVGANPSAGAVGLLSRAFARHRLDVAGPAPAFDVRAAVAAGECVWHACWALVAHDAPAAQLEARLTMPRGPNRAAAHLSADVVLRHAPQVYRRARSLGPSDPLVGLLERVLRQWPLSGVLADIAAGPLGPVDCGGHPGLQLLYAERWARHPKPAWRPEGRALESVELVEQERGHE